MGDERQSKNVISKIDQNYLELDDDPLGSGYYGSVYRGRLKNEHGSVRYRLVAVKMLHDPNKHTDPALLQHLNEELCEEVRIMSRIGQHENVLQLIGTMQYEDRLCLVTELCSLGSLDIYLKSAKNNFINEIVRYCWTKRRTIYKAEEDENWISHYEQKKIEKTVTTSDLLCFAYQIANGMEFVHSKEIVHRDLGLRNILLTSNYVVKIGDFGLSRRTSSGLYEKCQNTRLPFKWTAPEALSDDCVPIESDLYTFGILLWELFSLGEMPYKQLKNIHEVINFVVYERKILNKPPFAPDEMYNLMISLWNLDVNLRTPLKQCKRLLMKNLKAACPTLATRFGASAIVSMYEQPNRNPNKPVIISTKIRSQTLPDPANTAITSKLNRQSGKELSRNNRKHFKVPHAPVTKISELQPLNSKYESNNEMANESQGTSSLILSPTLSQMHHKPPPPSNMNQKNDTVNLPTKNEHRKNPIKKYRWILIPICALFILAAIILAVVIGSKIIETSDPEYQTKLGDTYRYGQGISQSYEKAVKWYRKAAEQGYAAGQYNLGLMYENGWGVNRSYEKAVICYRKAAEQGNADGQNSLGLMYFNGWGVNNSYAEAVRWYTKADDQDNAEAPYNLGLMHQNGWGMNKSDKEAVKWYRKAAQRGNAHGQNSLGLMYQNGWGVDKSYEEAVKWYRKAAEQGHAEGQNNLGFMYYYGYGVNKSGEDAVKWFIKAAEQQFGPALFSLTLMYGNGWSVNRSIDEAMKWCRIAAELDYDWARKQLVYLEKNKVETT